MNKNLLIATTKEIQDKTGLTSRAIRLKAQKEAWTFFYESCRGGQIKKWYVDSIPDLDFKAVLIGDNTNGAGRISTALVPLEQNQPTLFSFFPSPKNGDGNNKVFPKSETIWTPERAVNPADLKNPRLQQRLSILREVDEMPLSWTKGRRAYIEAIGLKHSVHPASIYRWLERREQRDIAGLRHTKKSQGQPKSWNQEALEFWKGLVLKREHRGIRIKDLFELLAVEAQQRNWEIGGYRSAVWWVQKINPLLKTLSRGGMRALDNKLPSILRDYSDLKPFEILCGDQHRFDRWVVDDETGEVFRPECYLWQDLRTRIIYGVAVDKKYDGWLMGLALRIGIRIFGAFQAIYTDNGKPECSRYITGILSNMNALGFSWEQTIEIPSDNSGGDPEEINPVVILPDHRKAMVKNAKTKMNEGTFRVMENILESHFRLPGRTKRLSDDIHWQDVDQEEAEALAKDGKLLLASEHALMMYRAIDFYNREKSHRGVLKEWVWKPKPSKATPYDCVMACYKDGWRPRMISPQAADLVFLARDKRVVRNGRIEFKGMNFEHEALIGIDGRVDLRFNPMDLTEILVFQKDKFLCTAVPVELSSMKDMDLAEKKIREKAARRKRFSEDFKRLTSNIPDYRQFSTVPKAERVAAVIGKEKRKRAAQNAELYRPRTEEELQAEIKKFEEAEIPRRKESELLSDRPQYFPTDYDRFKWAFNYVLRGGKLASGDQEFFSEYERRMNPEEAENWQAQRELYEGNRDEKRVCC